MSLKDKIKIKPKPLSPAILPSVTLTTFLDLNTKKTTKVQDILDIFHENGFALAMILFGLPIAIPLPWPPGFTTIMGTPLFILSIQMILGYRKMVLPQKISNFELKNSTLIMLAKKSIPVLKFIELRLQSRFAFAKSVYCEQFIGIISLICSVAIAIPLPFTNSIPAWGIVVMTLGLIKRDGLVIIAGFMVSVIGVLIAIAAMFLSILAMKGLFYGAAQIL